MAKPTVGRMIENTRGTTSSGRLAVCRLAVVLGLALAAVLAPAPRARCANVFVPVFDITSWVDLDAEIQTRANFDLAFEGGYKYQAKVSFEYYNLDVESNPTQAIVFDGAQASIREVFGFLDFTYFTGFYGILGPGDHYAGHLYHMGTGFDYEGFYPLIGTGLLFRGRITERMAGGLFVYQRIGSEYINALDLTYSAGSDSVAFELYGGISDQVYRGGARFGFVGDEIEFKVTAGTLTISEGTQFDFDDFYFLAEEWFKMNRWNLFLSVFTRPRVHYNYALRQYVDTGETSDIDFNFDLSHTTRKGNLSVGGEFNIRTSAAEDLGISLSPYVSIFSSGLVWKIRVDANLLSQERDFVTGYVNLRSSF